MRQLTGRNGQVGCFRVGLAVPCQALSAASAGGGVIQPIPGLIVCPIRHGEARGGRHTLAGTNEDMLVRGYLYRRRFGAMHRCCVRKNTQLREPGKATSDPELPCRPVCRSRSAMPQRRSAGCCFRRAATRPSDRTASRRQRSPRWRRSTRGNLPETRPQSTAMILITREPHRCAGA